jgi:hypothetical protein
MKTRSSQMRSADLAAPIGWVRPRRHRGRKKAMALRVVSGRAHLHDTEERRLRPDSTGAAAAYISSLVADLSKLARDHRLDALTYVLEMARLEAQVVAGETSAIASNITEASTRT